MKVKIAQDVEARKVEMDGAEGVTMRMLIGPDDGAVNFNMRMFELAPGGHTPRHSHRWEHEVYVLRGSGTVVTPDGDMPLRPGQAVYVAPKARRTAHAAAGIPNPVDGTFGQAAFASISCRLQPGRAASGRTSRPAARRARKPINAERSSNCLRCRLLFLCCLAGASEARGGHHQPVRQASPAEHSTLCTLASGRYGVNPRPTVAPVV